EGCGCGRACRCPYPGAPPRPSLQHRDYERPPILLAPAPLSRDRRWFPPNRKLPPRSVSPAELPDCPLPDGEGQCHPGSAGRGRVAPPRRGCAGEVRSPGLLAKSTLAPRGVAEGGRFKKPADVSQHQFVDFLLVEDVDRQSVLVRISQGEFSCGEL